MHIVTMFHVSFQIPQFARLTLLEELQPTNKFVNIVCQAISVHHSQTDPKCVVLKVWDGTLCTFDMYRFCGFDQADCEPPEDLLARSHDSYVYIHVYDEHSWIARSIVPGDFVRISNMRQKFVEGGMLRNAINNGFISQQVNILRLFKFTNYF